MPSARAASIAVLARRMLALGCAGLVLALGLLSVSPNLHRHLHEGSGPVAHDHCAVELFAAGAHVPAAITAPLPPQADWREGVKGTTDSERWTSSRHLLPPGCGPPAA